MMRLFLFVTAAHAVSVGSRVASAPAESAKDAADLASKVMAALPAPDSKHEERVQEMQAAIAHMDGVSHSSDAKLLETYSKMETDLVKDIARTKNHTETNDKLMASMEAALKNQAKALKTSIATYKAQLESSAKHHHTLQDLMGTLSPNHINGAAICAEKNSVLAKKALPTKPLKDALKLKLVQLDGPNKFSEAADRVNKLEAERKQLTLASKAQDLMWENRIKPLREENKKLEAELHEASQKVMSQQKAQDFSKTIDETLKHVMALAAKCK